MKLEFEIYPAIWCVVIRAALRIGWGDRYPGETLAGFCLSVPFPAQWFKKKKS